MKSWTYLYWEHEIKQWSYLVPPQARPEIDYEACATCVVNKNNFTFMYTPIQLPLSSWCDYLSMHSSKPIQFLKKISHNMIRKGYFDGILSTKRKYKTWNIIWISSWVPTCSHYLTWNSAELWGTEGFYSLSSWCPPRTPPKDLSSDI